MKMITLPLLLLANTLMAQLKNPGFEISIDSLPLLPKDWHFKPVDGYQIMLDNTVSSSNKRSLKVYNTQVDAQGNFISFSQVCEIKVEHPERIAVTAYIKTLEASGDVGLWCQLLDKQFHKIGFENLQGQGVRINGTNDWTKYTLSLSVDTSIHNLLLGGLFYGGGAAWFDSFQIEGMPMPDSSISKTVMDYIGEFTEIIKSHSLFADSLNWTSINSQVKELAKGVKTIDDSKFITSYIINKLRNAGDNHSFFQSKEDAGKYAAQKTSSEIKMPVSKYLGDNIGYIKVPGFGSINDSTCLNFATQIQDLIRSVDLENNITGWVVDLRENTGGNMYPMIAGLGPLIKEGTAGYFLTAKHKTPIRWFYSKGGSGEGNRANVKVEKPYLIKNQEAKIAVLIGPKTASSGEMTTISFIGKQNTQLFGQPSGGYTTANEGFKLSDGSYIYLATSYTADRNKKKYLGKIDPDVTIEINKTDGSDNAIDAAKKWLLKN